MRHCRGGRAGAGRKPFLQQSQRKGRQQRGLFQRFQRAVRVATLAVPRTLEATALKGTQGLWGLCPPGTRPGRGGLGGQLSNPKPSGRGNPQPQEVSKAEGSLTWFGKKRNHFKALVHHPRANSRSSQEKQRGSFFPLHQLPWPLGSALLPEAPGGWPALEGDAEAQKGCSCTGNSGDACRARRRRAGTENLPSEEGQSRNRTESEHSLAAPRHTLCAGHADGLPVDPAGPGEQFQAPVPEHFCAETRRWALGNLLGRDLDFTPGEGLPGSGPH